MKAAISQTELDALLDAVREWAASRPDIRAVALVGSYARADATADSDVDIVVLTTEPDAYVEDDDWTPALAQGTLVSTKRWGAITERRLKRPDGLEIEVGIGGPSWASVDPVDPGTLKVVRAGLRIVHDPEGLLRALISACS